MSAYQTLVDYHCASKHRHGQYARGPDTLDWDAQPSPFRCYEGAPSIALPLTAADYDCPFGKLRAPALATLAQRRITLDTLGAWLQLSLAISAWKDNGVDRWALRCNPSSGNLHPTEAYLIVAGIDGLDDGVYHYRVEDHALEQRAAFAGRAARPQLAVGLSAVVWREAWKYGERALRYCALDAGHAAAALAYSAAVLGWQVAENRQLGAAQLASLLGLDRNEDFRAGRSVDTEREEAELLLCVQGGDAAAFEVEPMYRRAAEARWCGHASLIDARPMYRWPLIDEALAASRHVASAGTTAGDPRQRMASLPPLSALGGARGSVATLTGRRSGQRYAHDASMAPADFFHLLDTLLPRPQAPWQTLAAPPPPLALLLFVHRVDGLTPGLYLLLRDDPTARELPALLRPEFRSARRVAGLDHIDLRLLAVMRPAELARIARSLCCHQDIAATACFAAAMLAPFERTLGADAAHYRRLFHAAGLLGQVLYLEAEALGYRGTGIGCYFDDALHELLGLQDLQWQSLYHFAVGAPLIDERIQTTPPYPARTEPMKECR